MRLPAFLALCFIVSSQARGQNEEKKSVQANPSRQSQQTVSSTPPRAKAISANKGTEAAQQNQNHEADHAKNERLIAYSTLALAILTFLLALATAVLARFTYKLWDDTRTAAANQFNVMSGQLDAMKEQGAWLKESVAVAAKSAKAALAGANAANEMASQSGRQVNVGIETLDQLRRDFVVANRPRLLLRRIYFAKDLPPIVVTTDASGGYTEALPISPEDTPQVRIEMANIGGVGIAKASLRVTFIIFNTGQPIPWKIQEELARAIPQPMDISHGGSGVLVVKVPAVGALFSDQDVVGGGHTVYCIGYTEYTDETETLVGRTGFIRRCDIRNRWFLPDDSPGGADFEYAD